MVMHPDNSKRDILVIGELPADGVDDATITVKAKYFVIIIRSRKKIESSLQCSHFFFFFFFFVGVCKKNVHAYAYGHPDHSKKDILVIGELPTDGLGDTTITTEAKYFLLSLSPGKKLFDSSLQGRQ